MSVIILSGRRLNVFSSQAANDALRVRAAHLSTLLNNDLSAARWIHHCHLTGALSATSNSPLQPFSSELDLRLGPLTGPVIVVKVHLMVICQ